MLDLLDAAGVEQATLVGHSLGSLIALEAAARAPERVAHLAMVGTAYPMKVSPALLEGSLDAAAEGHRHGQRFSHSSWRRRRRRSARAPGCMAMRAR